MTLLYTADCAEKILGLYKADTKKSIAGIQAGLADTPPVLENTRTDSIERKKRFYETRLVNSLEIVFRLLFRYIFLMSDTQLFIPYYGKYSARGSAELKGRKFYRLNLFQGCRMSFRADLLRQNLFDSDLVKYSAGEDSDLSYRISRQGDLIECSDALIYHRTAAAGRMNRFKSSSMHSFNLALVC